MFHLGSILLLAGAFAAPAHIQPGGAPAFGPPRWKYKVVRGSELTAAGNDAKARPVGLTDALNKLGADGWELVSVVPDSRQQAGNPAAALPDPEQIWKAVANGKDRIDLNAEEFASLKASRVRRGRPIPENGILTKEMFLAELKERAVATGPTYYFKRPKR